MKIGSRISITGLFYYTGIEIQAENNLIIEGQFDFMLVQTLIFEEIKENYPLFDTLSEMVELNKWQTVKLSCIVKSGDVGKYYDIEDAKILK